MTAGADARLTSAGHHSGATVFTIQADCSSRNYTEAGAVRHIREAPRFSLKRLLLRDCPALAESALCSLAGHAELETLDLSRSPQALLDAFACALEKLKGELAVLLLLTWLGNNLMDVHANMHIHIAQDQETWMLSICQLKSGTPDWVHHADVCLCRLAEAQSGGQPRPG